MTVCGGAASCPDRCIARPLRCVCEKFVRYTYVPTSYRYKVDIYVLITLSVSIVMSYVRPASDLFLLAMNGTLLVRGVPKFLALPSCLLILLRTNEILFSTLK